MSALADQPDLPTSPYRTTAPRRVAQIHTATEKQEGAGMRVRRAIGTPRLRHLTPFLMLDHLDSAFGGAADAGAPDHPHRGQETITHVLAGVLCHEDFAGHSGELRAGDLQFMTAGRGIVHSEAPRGDAGGRSAGLQVWVDLPRALKACEPRYRDLRAAEVPRASADGGRVEVRVVSGTAFGVQSEVQLSYTPVWYLHFSVRPGGRFELPLPGGWNAFCYVMAGGIVVGDGGEERACSQFSIAVFEQAGDRVEIAVPQDAQEDADFIVVAGLPLDQPVVQYGPFVGTSREEVMQAVVDFQTGQNGFERAVDWISESTRSRRNSFA